jgi:two-component system phosphate regulon response regulator PhoB
LKNGYTGVDLIKELKRKSVYKDIPIICLSAHAYGENKRKAEELGANIYLTKPVSNKVLLSTVNKLIDVNEEAEKET